MTNSLRNLLVVLTILATAAVAFGGDSTPGKLPSTFDAIAGVDSFGRTAPIRVFNASDGGTGTLVVSTGALTTNVYGAVQVATTATAIPTSGAAGRYTLTVQNLGPARICCGYSSGVTASNGLCIPAATLDANSLPQNGSSIFNVAGGKVVYCISATLQVTPADTRYLEE